LWVWWCFPKQAPFRTNQRADNQSCPRAFQCPWAGPDIWFKPYDRVEIYKKKAELIPDVAETLLPSTGGDVLELDELWSFVAKKTNKYWIWIALCRRTRQVVSWCIGARDEERCQTLWDLVPAPYKASMLYSDFYAAYAKVLQQANHEAVGKGSGQTNHVERWNNTLRQRIPRFIRKTLSFSKSDKMHGLYLKLFIHYYNLEKAAAITQ